jgi:hypothetical protein
VADPPYVIIAFTDIAFTFKTVIEGLLAAVAASSFLYLLVAVAWALCYIALSETR